MKLKEYIEKLKKLEKKYGESDLIYGIDDEGNGFNYVYFGPSVKFISKETRKRDDNISCEEMEEFKSEEKDIAVICLN